MSEFYKGVTLEHQRMADDTFSSVKIPVEIYGNPCWGAGVKFRIASEQSYKSAQARITELEAENARNTWQPIETAPKDGSWILVWEKDYDCPMSAQWGLLNINPNKYDGVHGWSGNGYIFSDVTHWLPMPAMPIEATRTAKDVKE